MSKLWKVLRHWKAIVELFESVKLAGADRKVSQKEAKEIADRVIDLGVKVGLLGDK